MHLLLPTTVTETQEHVARGAVPVGGATLVWAEWQRDGFPPSALSLRELPQAQVLRAGEVGGAVVLQRLAAAGPEHVPEVLRRAAAQVGTGAVRRAATVGGNLVGSALRCLLPAALVLEARGFVVTAEDVYEAELGEVVTKRQLLLALRWREPLASGYRKLPAAAGGPPPAVVAVAVHEDGRLRVAVREGYEVRGGAVPCDGGAERTLQALRTHPELGRVWAGGSGEALGTVVRETLGRPWRRSPADGPGSVRPS